MRQAATAVQEQHAGQLRSVVGALVTSDAEPVPICSGCGDPMGVQKTVLRQGHTLAHGTFEVRETVSICGNGCRRPASTQDLGPAAEPAKPGPLVFAATQTCASGVESWSDAPGQKSTHPAPVLYVGVAAPKSDGMAPGMVMPPGSHM